MTRKLVECIPNFSEGRRQEVIQSIASAIASVPNIVILDQHSDHDHNRSVITFAGPPDEAVEAAFNGIAKAAELIDLDLHQGEHPRIGAADVVPFVPLAELTLEDCVDLAKMLAKRVADELNIPVYLYEAAATTPERVNLEGIRRGEYEKLKELIGSDPARAPDFGPSRLPKAGATVIGARSPLIAYNVYLNTDRVEVAKAIAKAVRHSSGGLRFVKALGLLVEGRAQVSMNLTDYRKTSVARVVEMIRREAVRHGVAVERSELVGLTPQAALVDAAQWYLQLDEFDFSQILESRIYEAAQKKESPFLDRLAAGTPTPGGGSAAAFAGAMTASLASMVAQLTVGKSKYEDVQGRMKSIVKESKELKEQLEGLVDRDAQAFEDVLLALRMPRETENEQAARTEALEMATTMATEVPLEVAQLSLNSLLLAKEAAEIGNQNAITDAGAASEMAMAAIRSAGYNVKINLESLSDDDRKAKMLAEFDAINQQASEAYQAVEKILADRAGLQI
jgi:glutamate formiminotransferase/formiminotetrahydrofolate cyclodeaminase